MSPNNKLDDCCKHNTTDNHTEQLPTTSSTTTESINDTNNPQINNNCDDDDIHTPNNSSSGSNTVKEIKLNESGISLSQITETNSSTPHSKSIRTRYQRHHQQQQHHHINESTFNSSLSSNNDYLVDNNIHHSNNNNDHKKGGRYDNTTKFSYIKALAESILETPRHEILLNDLYVRISSKYPELKDKRADWQNGIRHNLSLNECFIKLRRNPTGKGNYWGVSPSNIGWFLKNDYRRRWKQTRSRYKRSKYARPDESGFVSSDYPSPILPQIQDHFVSNYTSGINNDRSYAPLSYYHCNPQYYRNNYPHTAIQQQQQPPYHHPMSYHLPLNNGYYLNNNFNHGYDYCYDQPQRHLDISNSTIRCPAYPQHLRLPYQPYVQNWHDEPVYHSLTPYDCGRGGGGGYSYRQTIPYFVEENNHSEMINTSNNTNTVPTNPSPLEPQSMVVEPAETPLPHLVARLTPTTTCITAPLSNNSQPLPSSDKPIIKSYFKSPNPYSFKSLERAPKDDSDTDTEERAKSSKFDLNSLLNK